MKIANISTNLANQLSDDTAIVAASVASNTVGSYVGSLGWLTVQETDSAPSSAGVVTLKVPTNTLTDNGSSTVTLSYLKPVDGAVHTVKAHGNLGSSATVNLADGNYHTGTLTASATIGFTGWTNGSLCEVGVRLTENSTGGYTPTFTGVTWVGGTVPTHDTTNNTVTDYVFWSTDGGTTIYGGMVGAGSSTSASSSSGTDHIHAVGEVHTADGSASTYYLANYPEDLTVAAYQNGLRVDVTQILDAVTFAGVPPAGAALRFDYLAEIT